MDLQIDGNTALVTASSSGLGRASAKALAREGVDVVINGRDEAKLKQAAEDIRQQARGDVQAIAGSITEPETIERLVEGTVDTFGELDHLVTSSGGPPSGAFLDTDDSDWHDAYELLVMSVVRLAREAESHLRQDGGGTIVTITSRSVKEALDSLVLSNAVRMGVIGLGKTLSREFAPEVRVNSVLPGPHETPRIRELIETKVERGEYENYDAGMSTWSDDVPLERIGRPMELGNTVAFLSSPLSGFINGAALPIDGGAGKSNL